jgi:acetyl esterase/lipase
MSSRDETQKAHYMQQTFRNISFRSAVSLLCGCVWLFAQAQPAPKPAPPQAKVQYPDNVEALVDVTYTTLPGYRPLKLDLYRVPGGAPKPAIVYVHGGGFEAGHPRMNSLWGTLDNLMAQIAARGYVVAAVSYRLSSEAKFPAQLEDVKGAIRWVRANAANYGIDPERVAIWGESVGGSVAALVGTTCGMQELEGRGGNAGESSCVRAAVDWYGVTDMALLDKQAPPNATLIHNSPDSTQSKVLGCVLHYQCPASVVAKANPISYIDPSDVKVSFLILHGDADTVVAWQQSRIFYGALRAKQIEAKLEILPGVNHNFAGATPQQAQHILDITFGFLTEKLAPKSR